MQALIVEDDDNKRAQLVAYMAVRFPDAILHEASSLMSGVRLARSLDLDVVLLDMTLPNYDVKGGETGGGMHAFGGVEFLRQIRRFQVPVKVIVVTQFETFGQPPDMKDLPQLNEEMRSAFQGLYVGAVYYHASIEDWADKLSSLIEGVAHGD